VTGLLHLNSLNRFQSDGSYETNLHLRFIFHPLAAMVVRGEASCEAFAVAAMAFRMR
jgi:hypothetical protein